MRTDETARGVIRALTVVGPVTLLTSLAYYFGWTATHASARYLGIDESILGFSTQDYLLRSITALFWPLCVGLGLAALALQAHGAVAASIARDRTRTTLVISLSLVGASMVLYGVLALGQRWTVDGFSIAPLSLTLGIGLVSYAVAIRNRPSPRSTGFQAVSDTPPLTVVCISLLLAAGLFWQVAEWATAVGVGATQALIADLSRQPAVTVFAVKRLNLEGPGVTMTQVDQAPGAYGYRYTGLRLLFRANDRYFMLSDRWSPDAGVLFVVNDTPDVRLQFSSGTG